MSEVVAPPSLHMRVFPLKDFNILVDLATAQEPSKLAHENPIRNMREGLEKHGQRESHPNASVVSALAVLERHVAGREVDVLPLE